MRCPACGRNKARRACPALAQTICPVCCGTKRLVEIACPEACTYLAASRQHPAAVVQRQQAYDVAALLPTLRHLTERQHQLFFLFQTLIAQFEPEGFARLLDADVADAAAALAGSLETASRGVIYDQAAASSVAQKLADEMRRLLEQVRTQGANVRDLEAAGVLRAIEHGARPAGGGDGDATAYLQLMARLLQRSRRPQAASLL
jgi:hypothetical protein